MTALPPYDDAEIADDDLVIRRIHPRQVIFDHNTGFYRVSTGAFSPSSEPHFGMSVDVKSSIESVGAIPAEHVRDPKHVGAVEFAASVPRSNGLVVGKAPLPENEHHGEVWRVGQKRFSRTQQKAFLENCVWLIEIDSVKLN